MRTINIYTFDELSDDAKETAIKSAREKGITDTIEHCISDAVKTIENAAEAFGFRLADYNIGSEVYRCSVKLAGNSTLENEEITGQRLRTWLMNNCYDVFYCSKTYGKQIRAHSRFGLTKYQYQRHSRVITVQNDCPFTGVCYDEDFLDCFRAFLKKPTEQTLEELFEEGAHDVCKSLESEEQYYLQDSSIAEFLESNQYEFTEEGEFI